MVRLWTAWIIGDLEVYLDDNEEALYKGPAQDFFLDTYDAIAGSEGQYNVDGVFSVGETLVGAASSASYQLRLIDTDINDDGFADNTDIETEADSILDFTEENPFGIP